MTVPSIFTQQELQEMGFRFLGRNVVVDRSVQFFGLSRISIGDNTRIDAHVVLATGEGGISIGAYCHLAVGVSFHGAGGVTVEDYTGFSARVALFSSTDGYSGGAMSNPTIPMEYRGVVSKPVLVRQHALVGSMSVVMPGVEIGVGASVGALTFVNKSIPDFCIVSGNPPRKIGERDRENLLKVQREFEQKHRSELELVQ